MSEHHPSGAPPGGADTGPVAGITTSGAGLGIRIGARIIDHLLVAVVAVVLLAILGALQAAWASVLPALLGFGYFVWLESTQGATLGKKLLSLRVVGPDQGLPSAEVSAKRNVWLLFGIIPWIGPLLWLVAVIVIIATISSSPDNRGYHDTFAGSSVLQ
jgi:uncharacterized RDD family membrane protein YckC